MLNGRVDFFLGGIPETVAAVAADADAVAAMELVAIFAQDAHNISEGKIKFFRGRNKCMISSFLNLQQFQFGSASR